MTTTMANCQNWVVGLLATYIVKPRNYGGHASGSNFSVRLEDHVSPPSSNRKRVRYAGVALGVAGVCVGARCGQRIDRGVALGPWTLSASGLLY